MDSINVYLLLGLKKIPLGRELSGDHIGMDPTDTAVLY